MRQRHYSILLVLAFALVLIMPGAGWAKGPSPDTALPAQDPHQAVEQAWKRVQEAGSYRFLSTADQTMIPRPVPEMIGQGDVHLTLENDGAVVLPGHAYIELRVAGAGREQSVTLLRNGNQSFLWQDGTLDPVDDTLSVAALSTDMLGYLAAAEQVALLAPPEGHPDLTRYGFRLNGERFEAYVRQQTQEMLAAEPGAPDGLTLQPSPALQTLGGQGELWVNQAGLPVRQVLDVELPQANAYYGARLHLVVDLSAYGQIESLPKAVQGPDGAWRMEGELPPQPDLDRAGLSGATASLAQSDPAQPDHATTKGAAFKSEPTDWLRRASSLFPLRTLPSSLVLFGLILLAILAIRYYRRYPRHCYTLLILALIPTMVFTPILQAGQVVTYIERQAQAQAARQAATPDLLRALGMEPEAVPTASAAPDEAPADAPDAHTPVREGVAPWKSETGAIPRSSIQMLETVQEPGMGLRCGDGEPGVDTDGDGLDDTVELCLGTSPRKADTDEDGIPDKIEVDGFDYAGKHWTSDPLSVDSNGDGVLDILEWCEDDTPNGLAPAVDIDGDGIPNLWDEDDDADGVPDGLDLSPFARSDYTNSLSPSIEGSGFSGYVYLQVQVQPQNQDHLRYSTTALDWPMDDEGNVQDLDLSTDDLRLVPFLLVTTNVQPQTELAAKYGFSSWQSDEGYTLLVPLLPVGEAGAIHAFSGKVAYAPGQSANIQWQAEMVWMAQMQVDHSENWSISTAMRVLHQYKESFRLTGLDVTQDGGYEAAVLGTPLYEDDLRLFRLLLGLNDTFKSNLHLEGQISGETALEEIAERFAPGSTAAITHTFGITPSAVVMSGPVEYGHADAALAGIGSNLVPNLLSTWDAYYGNQRCRDVEGNPVSCASLIIAFEQSLGAKGLSEIPQTSSGVADLDQLHFNLANIPLITSRGVQMRMYEEGSGGWQVVTPSRMLELVEARYSSTYATALRNLYPGLEPKDLRFISYTAYLWAMSPSYSPVAADGQPLVPDLADETELAQNRALPAEFEAEVKTAIDFFALGSGLADAVGVGEFITWATSDFIEASSNWDSVGVGLFVSSVIASTAMSLIYAFCDSGMDLGICGQEEVLQALDVVVSALNIIYQSQWVVDMVIKYGVGVLKNVSTLAMTVSAVGVAISAGVIWATFAMLALTSSDPVSWRVALADAIVTTLWMIFMFALNFIPIIGQIISAVLALIDMILALFTGLFTDQTWSIATAILNLFYDADVCTTLKDAAFGEISSGLGDPDGGMVGGNTLLLNIPATGIIQKEEEGTDDDLRDSWVKGQMTWEWPAYDQSAMFTATDMTQEPDCVIVGTELHCNNTATLGYALTPRINGLVTFAGRINYQYVWAETGLYGAFRYATHTEQATLPDDADKLAPNKMYVDVLPATMDQLWTWPALTNPDQDGDELDDSQETLVLGTDPSKWDSDGDGLSDRYEWLTFAERGANPLLEDTDGDGLNDGIEWRLGTRIDVADTDGDGLSDGEEVRRLQGGVMVGGWQLTLSDRQTAWVSSDPLKGDSDGDGLSDAEEKAHVLSPQAVNSPVPTLSLSVTPIRGIPGGRLGAYWETDDAVAITVELSNFAWNPVTTTLTLELPTGLADVQGGTMQGDRTVTPGIGSWGGETRSFTWSFTGADKLQVYEVVSTTLTARVSATSAHGEIALRLPYSDLTLRKTVSVVADGDNPEVTILAPANGAYLRGESYVAGGSASDPTTWLTGAELSIVPQGSGTDFGPLSGSLSPWAYSWSLPTSDGVYSLQARATDAMGHVGTSTAISVTVDNTAPTATLVAAMDGDTVRLSGTASDNLAGVAWVQLSIDGQPWRSVSLNGSALYYAWSYDWTVGENAQGQHMVSLRVVDRSGNVGDILTEEITVDQVAPSSIVNRGADPETPPAAKPNAAFTLAGVADEGGRLPLPAVPADLRTGMDVFSDSTVWLGLSSVAENDGGVLATWIGDFDADRLADLAVGLPGPDGDAGRVAVLYGRAGGWPTPPDMEMLATAQTRYVGASGARLGSYLAAAGDANGDNFADLLIGERASTRAFLVFGNPHWLGEITLDAGQSGYRTLLQAPDTIQGQAPDTIQGLATAGDVNGDGYDDLLIRTGGTAYLLLGRMGPWPETVDVAAEAAERFTNVSGALGVGDVDNDQKAEWVTLGDRRITLHGWEEADTSIVTTDAEPRAVALGDVNGDGLADWLYTNGENRTLMYGAGPSSHTFYGYGGLLAAPGDVDGDGRADILLTDAAGVASLIRQQANQSPAVFATISGVGGVANAPYAAGADLNADGSADLLLIPSQAAAQARGFDAPSFAAGFVSPQSLPLGASSATGAGENLRGLSANILSAGADTRYVDDDAVGSVCDGHSPCYTTIQAAVDASDGGGDTIIVYPGVYAGFRVPAGANFDRLTVQGVSADAVFVERGAISVDAIHVAADGVRLVNLTVRGATSGVVLEDGAGEPTSQGGSETVIDRLLAHSVQYPIYMSQGAALSLTDSTLVGDGTNPILHVDSGSSSVHSWTNDRAVPTPVSAAVPITGSGTLVSAGGSLYALAGGSNSAIYQATPGADGALGNWSNPFSLRDPLPTNTSVMVQRQGESLLAGSGAALYQLHSTYTWPNLGGTANGFINAVAISPVSPYNIYVGGDFSYIGGVTAKNIARWDGTSWHALIETGGETNPGTNGVVEALAFDPSGNLYVGGNFTLAGRLHCGHVAGWDPQTQRWFPMGIDGCNPADCDNNPYNGVNGPVYALACDSQRLYIGGDFQRATEWGDAAGGNGHWSYNLAIWTLGCSPSSSSFCFQNYPPLQTSGTVYPITSTVRSLALYGNTLYVGGDFYNISKDPVVWAKHIAKGVLDYTHPTPAATWYALGSGLDKVYDMAVDSGGRLYVAGENGTSTGIFEWNGTSWSGPASGSGGGNLAVAVDQVGNVYTSNNGGAIKVKLAGSSVFQDMAGETYFTGVGFTTSQSQPVQDFAVDASGQLYGAPAAAKYEGGAYYYRGALSRWMAPSLIRRAVPSGSWTRLAYPSFLPQTYAFDLTVGANALVGDGSGNLYGLWGTYAQGYQISDGVLGYYNSASAAWESRATPPTSVAFKHLAWADGKLYAMGHYYYDPYPWRLYRYDPGTNAWSSSLADPSFIPDGQTSAQGLSWAWDGSDSIYLLRGDGTRAFYRYRLSTNVWETLPDASVSMAVSYGPAMARLGSYLYTYATPTGGATTNLFRYGKVGMPDLRLTVDRTAFVAPESATSFAWTNLSAATGSYRFGTDIDTTNAWVGKASATWSPTLPTSAIKLTWAQADFVAPEDGLYRLGASSTLSAGYHHYMALAHVYPGQAACAACDAGEATWGETAFATIREAVESGAARVLVHPGRYPQSFYLVSGVDVIGSGAELTIIAPPAGTAGALVAAEGVAGSSLARVTLAGGSSWQGLLAEGGAKGLNLTRCTIRDLGTGVRLRGGSEVEVVNNTIVGNADGLVAEGYNPVSVRNTILAYNTGTGLKRGAGTTSLSNTYNAFWANGKDMDPVDVGGGNLFRDPLFRDLGADDLRLAEGSPLIDMGAPNDPTLPGGGTRVDIGYAEYNAANFYVSTQYSETGLNDGLVWEVDAFDTIQAALDAAVTAQHGLRGTLPEGGYSVGVDQGTYSEQVTVPSHVRLIGSGAASTTINAGGTGSAVTFDGVVAAEVSGFTLRGAGAAGVQIKNASNGITIARNVITGNAGHGISLEGRSSGAVSSNTIVGNAAGAGVYANGSGTRANVRNNVLDSNAYGLQAVVSGQIRNDYNLLDNATDVSDVTAGSNTVTSDPAFAATGHYVLTASSPAVDAADPLAEVPLAGGVRADLGYKELVASPLTLVFGPRIASTVTGNSGVAKVEVGVSYVTDAAAPVTATIPSTWQTLTPTISGPPLYYWSKSESQATSGLYRVYSKATDAAGNAEDEGLDAYEGSFVVDGTAPTVAWGTPALPTSTSAAGAWAVAQVTGLLNTGSGTRDDVAQVYFGVTGAATATYPAERDGNVYRAWIPFPATGSYTINAVAIDEAGNQAQASASVAVSASNSVATVSEPPTNSAVNGVEIALRGAVRFTAAGAGAVAVTVDSTTVQATLESPGSVFSAWTAEVTLPTDDGTKTVTVTPSLGGAAGTVTTLNLSLDATAPTLSITTPAAGSSATQSIAFTGTASDADSGLARVEVSVDGGYTWRPAALSGADWSMAWPLSDRVDYVTYPAQVRAVDMAGNMQLIARPVAVDNVPPSGLPPVTFSEPVGQHLERGESLTISWNTPMDGGVVAGVKLMQNGVPDAVPSLGFSASQPETVHLNNLGDQYVHLMAQDAAGNQALYHYGPWHVRDMANAAFGARRQSVIVDGFIDLAHNEWLSSDLLGTDAQGLRTQQLYASWDGQAIYLGWSGAWWTLDGAMWAYLDAADGGSTQPVSGTQVLPIEADLAVLVDSPVSGALYAWNGSAWGPSASPFAFSQGPSGDSETSIAYGLAADDTVQLVAFALPREDGVNLSLLSAHESGTQLAATEDGGQPWVIFPNTNPLGDTPTESYNWNTPVVPAMNAGQPAARTVNLEVSSPQAGGVAWCPGNTLQYNIVLRNPEPTAISGLTLTLTKTEGLIYGNVTGANATATSDGLSLGVPPIAAGTSHNITVAALLATDLSSRTAVSTTFGLSAGGTALTGSPIIEVLTHQVDGQAPSVTIDALPGGAIAGGSYRFTGTVSDGLGSGVASVQVRQAGAPGWQTAVGTLAWSATLDTPTSGTFTLNARAVDACGHGSVVTQTYNIDSTPPEISWSVPSVITSTMALLGGETWDPAPAGALVARVDVQLGQDGLWQNASALYNPVGQGNQTWVWAWNTPMDDGAKHTLRARAYDAVGQLAVTGWMTTTVDVVAPRLTVTQLVTSTLLPNDGNVGTQAIGPAAGAPWRLPVEATATAYLPFVRLSGPATGGASVGLSATPLPILRGTVTDGAGVQAVKIVVYDPQGGSRIENATLTGGDWEYASDLVGWAVGAYALRVQAVDRHGNVSLKGPYGLQVQEAPISGLEATNDGPKMIGEPVTLTASVVTGSNVIYEWNLGDGTTAVGRSVKHDYTQPGEFTATVTAHNSVSTMPYLTASTAVTILSLSVEAGADQSALEGQEVVIHPIISDQRTGLAYGYSVAWGDGTAPSTGTVAVGALTFSVGHAYADDGVYPVTVTVGDGSYAASDTLQVTVSNVAPVVNAGEAAAIKEGETLSVSGSFTDPGTDTWTATVDYSDGSGVQPLSLTDKAFTLNHVYADDDQYTVTVCVTDDDGGSHCDTATATVANVAPDVTADPGSQAVQYSETITEITFTAIDVAADSMTALLSWSADGGNPFAPGAPAGLALSAGACAVSDGLNTCTWKVTGNVALPAGAYTLRLTVTDKDGGATDRDVRLFVQVEEALVAFGDGNPVAVRVATAGGASGAFTLGICVSERDVPPAGDISLAQVSMTLVPIGPGSPVAGVPGVPTVEPGEQCVVFSFEAVPVNTYAVLVTVGGGYYMGRNEDTLVVYDPSLGFTTGGGWFYWPDTADEETGYLGDRTNLGYTMKYNKKGENVQGNLLLIRHMADGTLYRVKSNALYGLSLGESSTPTMGWASFSGKSTYQEPTWPEPIGNREFRVYVEDRNEPGIGVDRFWIEVVDGLSLPRKAMENAVWLNGGNIVVPHKPGNDTEPPVVSITSPQDGETVSGETVSITADATCAVGVTQVEFLVDDSSIGVDSDGSDGWAVTWSLTGVPDGTHTIKATATANDGQTGSHSISVTVDNVVEQTIRVKSLTGIGQWVKTGTTWKATVTVQVSPALAGAVVSGVWSTGVVGTCTTDENGVCSIVLEGLNKKTASVTFTVSNIVLAGYTFDPTGTTPITVAKPR